MSTNDDVARVDYLNTLHQGNINYSVANYATLGLSIAGTISTGTFVVEASTDGVEWEEIPIAKGGNQLANNEIVAVGSYIVGVAGYTLARLVPDTFTGFVNVTANISTRITPAFTIGLG